MIYQYFVIKNADATITRMLDAVSKTQAKRRVVKRTHLVTSYDDLQQMESFVMSWYVYTDVK
ncbi:hypothetical protein [Parapedobacter luteus]|uniref:hypothetical protein n=1 Tax=Parapedobacter luteus TaxID=623280 RepID=UPI0011179A88|nr:hypothetical protein [Parapedobacter luteus]